MKHALELLARIDALSLRDWVIAAAALSLFAAIAWIGRNVGGVIDAIYGLRERMRKVEGRTEEAEDSVREVDQVLSKRVRNVEVRQDRLQSKVDNQGKDWRDSMRRTQHGISGEITKIDWRKPDSSE